MIYCHDINGVFKGLIQKQSSTERRGFIDYSQRSLKAVLLHDENSKPSIPIAHSVHLKETYDEVNIILQAIYCNVQQWGICGDLKMTGDGSGLYEVLLLLNLWDIRSTAENYIKLDWEPRSW